MSQTEEKIYEFGLVIPEKYQKDIFLFNQSIPTIDEGLNGTVPEKIRRFNNSAIHLFKSILEIEYTKIGDVPILQLCQDVQTEYDIIYRQLIRNVYMELYIYQEKLLNIVLNIFFVKISRKRNPNIKGLRSRSIDFPLLSKFCDLCEQLLEDKKYKRVMSIRADETHNMSQIDSFVMELVQVGNGVFPVHTEYRIKAHTLREDYIYVVEQLLLLRNLVQEILDTYDLCDIYEKLRSKGKEIFVN